MSDITGSSTPLSSFSTIDQAIKQAYLHFQADLLPARSLSAQIPGSPSILSSTPLLISLPRQWSNKTYDVPHDLNLDLERYTLYFSITMTARNPVDTLK